jgi:hypothetical protein
MKRNPCFLVLLLITALCSGDLCLAQHCPEDSLLNLGTVDAHWFYRNESLNLSLPLPEGWYLYDYLATERKYLRVGSDYRKMSAALFAGGSGPNIDFAQLDKLPFGAEPILLSLASIADTASIIISPDEKHDTTISFRAAYADTTDVNALLKGFYKRIIRNSVDTPEIRSGKIGNLDYRFISVTAPNRAGLMENNLFCARNFGCINLLIRITYLSVSGRTLLFDACKELKLN